MEKLSHAAACAAGLRVRVFRAERSVWRGLCCGLFLLMLGGLGLGCAVDFSGPDHAECGDGVVEGVEQCEGEQLLGMGCGDVGFEGGTLSCGADCRLVLTACVNGCGNGAVEGAEECDDATANSDMRPDACRMGCRLPRCGDGVLDSAEQCDGGDVGDQTCGGLGLGDGELTCSEGCTLDTSDCASSYVCGDGEILEGVELCDGSDLSGQTCLGLGLGDGSLTCAAGCQGFDTSGCTVPNGGACTANAQCGSGSCTAEQNGGWPGGHCRQDCEGSECNPGSVCVPMTPGGTFVCLRECITTQDCRPGYACFDMWESGAPACWPHCETLGHCPGTGFCNQHLNLCGVAQSGQVNGAVCNDHADCASGHCSDTSPPLNYCISRCSLHSEICPQGGVCSNLRSGLAADLGYCLVSCDGAEDCNVSYDCIANAWGAGSICHP